MFELTIDLSFVASLARNVLGLRKGQIIVQTSPFAAGFIGEEKIMDSFELAVCFGNPFDTDYFSFNYIAFSFSFSCLQCTFFKIDLALLFI